ncbi:MAG: amidohydrolase family protein, partial [Bradymonadaceae bacterium]
PDDRGRLVTARRLWPMGGAHGAEALGLPAPGLEAGDPADFTAVDLDHLSLAGTDPSSLLSDLVFSIPPGAVSDVIVGGERIVADGQHPDEAAITEEFVRTVENVSL